MMNDKSKILIIEPSGTLVCDAPGCDNEITVGNLTPAMIGLPCSKCGANMLTEDDFKAHMALLLFAQKLNNFVAAVPGLAWIVSKLPRHRGSFHQHAGKVTMGPFEEVKD